jgi:hypothetical protein
VSGIQCRKANSEHPISRLDHSQLSAGLDAPGGGCLFPAAPHGPATGPDGTSTKAPLAIAAAIHSNVPTSAPPLQLICTGALTNAALFLTLYPELGVEGRVEIVLMGGAIGVGNTGPVQEFNIQTDPEAAHIVFESGIKVTMIPIEARAPLSLQLAMLPHARRSVPHMCGQSCSAPDVPSAPFIGMRQATYCQCC